MATPDPLLPYVSRFAAAWDRALVSDTGEGTFISVDVAGFSTLTERWSQAGRVGGERMQRHIDACLGAVVDACLDTGGDVLRFGGDAVRVLYRGDDHAAAACAGTQRALDAVRAFNRAARATGTAPARLRIGTAQGPWIATMLGTTRHEVVVTGPVVDAALAAERTTRPGTSTTVVARSAAGRRPTASSRPDHSGRTTRRVTRWPSAALVDPELVERLRHPDTGEHRVVTVMFVHAALPRDHHRDPDALVPLGLAVDAACDEFGLTWLNTDAIERGVQLTLTSDLPVARELPVERALGGARAIVAALGRVVRVGVHQCTAFSADIGSTRRRTFTIMGDGVNVTARLASSAAWGTVVATDDALHASSLQAEGARIRVVTTRGRRATVPARRVDHVVLAPRESDHAPLVGRTRELQRLRGLVETAASGAGASCAVRGAAGLGRTRLLDELAASLPTTVEVLRLDGRTQTTVGSDHAGVRDRIEALARGAAGDRAARRSTRATVVLVDDVAALDARTHEALAVLARAAADRPWCVVVTDSSPTPDPVVAACDHHITLAALSAAQTRRLVEATLTAGTDRSVERIVRDSGGNPRLALELVRAGDAGLSTSIEALTTRRIDRLPTRVRAVLRDASAFGAQVDLSLLELARASTIEPTDLLALRGLLDIVGPDSARFRDDLVLRVAYEGLARSRRDALHAAVAHVLVQRRPHDHDAIAHHAHAAHLDTLTWRHAPLAAAAAATRRDWERATELEHAALDAATRLGVGPSAHHACALRMAEAAGNAGNDTAAQHALRIATRSAPDARRRALAHRAAADQAQRTGRLDAARRHARSGLRALGTPRSASGTRVQVELELVAAAVEWDAGNLARSAALLEPLLDRPIVERTPELHAQVLLQWEAVLDSAGDPEAGAVGDAALALCAEIGDDRRFATLASNTGYSVYNRGDWREALRRFAAAEAAYARCGQDTMRAVVVNNRALILLDQARVAEARASFEQARRVFRAVGFSTGLAIVEMNLAKVAWNEGDLDAARALLASARRAFAALGTDAHDAETAVVAAEIARCTGVARTARRTASVAWNECERVGAPEALRLVARRLVADAEILHGRLDRAHERYEELLDAAIAFGSEHDELLARHGLALLRRARGVDRPAADEARDDRRRRSLQRRLGVRSLPALPVPLH